MNNKDEALKKARLFADSAYSAALSISMTEFEEAIHRVQMELSAKGTVMSGTMSDAAARLYGKQIDDLVLARLHGLLEGYELYRVLLDDQLAASTIAEVMDLRDTQISDTRKSPPIIRGPLLPGIFAELVLNKCKVSCASVNVEIQRRRLTPKKASAMNITYQLIGHGSRVNVNSTDNSVNVVISESELFSKIRKQIAEKVPLDQERDLILEKVTALEKEPDSRSRWERYTELIAVAANHMTILGPFIPALTEFVGKIR